MARRFFFVSMGILALAVAYLLGAQTARADWQPGAQGQVIGLANLGGATWKLVGSDGNSFSLDAAAGVWLPESIGLPSGMTVANVKFLDGSDSGILIITNSDEAWTTSGGGGWHSLGTYPGGSTATQGMSWGRVKGEFAR